MKIILKAKGEKVLVIFLGNNYPFVVATTPGKEHKPGDIISDWYWGTYFKNIDEALEHFNKKVE